MKVTKQKQGVPRVAEPEQRGDRNGLRWRRVRAQPTAAIRPAPAQTLVVGSKHWAAPAQKLSNLPLRSSRIYANRPAQNPTTTATIWSTIRRMPENGRCHVIGHVRWRVRVSEVRDLGSVVKTCLRRRI